MKVCEVCKKASPPYTERGICLRCYLLLKIKLRELDLLESSNAIG